MSRVLTPILICLGLSVALLVGSLWGEAGAAAPRPSRISASPILVDGYAAALCRRPADRETVWWDGQSFDRDKVAADLGETQEGRSVAQARGLYPTVLRRTTRAGDCGRIREWIDRRLSLSDAARDLAESPEGRRVAVVRQLFVDEFGRDPLDWDEGALRRWVDSPYTGAEIASRLRAQRPLVGVHYFTWYRMRNGAWGNDVTAVPGEAPHPAMGQYASDEAGVMRRHIGQMAALGIDFVIVHINSQSPGSWANARTLFRLLPGSGLEAAVLLDGLNTESRASKAMWVAQAREEFSRRPGYLSVYGQPLIMVFSAPLDFTTPGVVLRNVYWNDRYDPGANTFNRDLRLYPTDWPFWATSPQPLVNGIVPVIPGYIDTQLGRSRTMEHPRETGKLYQDQWRRALSLHPEFILIYSWNEYFERTAIEPTDAWGDAYLRSTACFVAHAHRGTTGDCP